MLNAPIIFEAKAGSDLCELGTEKFVCFVVIVSDRLRVCVCACVCLCVCLCVSMCACVSDR